MSYLPRMILSEMASIPQPRYLKEAGTPVPQMFEQQGVIVAI